MTNLLYDALLGIRAADRNRVLLELPQGASISYAEMAQRAAQVAGALRAVGVRPGDRVVAQVAKSHAALALYLGCLRAGAVFVPLNTAYTPSEMAYFIEDAAPSLILCDPEAEASLATAARSVDAKLHTLGAAGEGSWSDAVAAAHPVDVTPRGPDDLACFLYTSGTTGRSKGAMLTHGNLHSNAEALVSCWRFTEADRLLHALPIFHAHGLFAACNVAMRAGASMLWQPEFDTFAVLAALPRATVMMGVPTYYTRLLATPGLDRAATAHMRVFTSGSAPLLADTHAAFAARTGHAILERYGMTETGMITSNPYVGARRPGTVGMPLLGVDLRLCVPGTAKPVPPGETGMIEVCGPNVFTGYWKKPEKTAAELRPDGWFITGDLGQLDADGYLHIVGREKDLIISGGYNVYPKEVEQVLDALSGVAESAVIGVPHSDYGEGVLAIIRAEPGATPTKATLRTAAEAALANFKRPKAYIFADALPRNTMGKVQKAALRQLHADRFANSKTDAAE